MPRTTSRATAQRRANRWLLLIFIVGVFALALGQHGRFARRAQQQPEAGPSTPWAGTSTVQGQYSPPGVYDLPPVTPTGVANYYDSNGRRFKSPQV